MSIGLDVCVYVCDLQMWGIWCYCQQGAHCGTSLVLCKMFLYTPCLWYESILISGIFYESSHLIMILAIY